LVLVNFDHSSKGRSVAQQIEIAKRLFSSFSDHMHGFILKPWGKRVIVDPDDLTQKDIGQLRAFDIVGVTEQDLGAGLWERVKCVARLRKKLDDSEIKAPLHIWGGLDPVITPLYFFAGAQVFDGCSWLRYAYLKGMAINKMSYQVVADAVGVTNNRIMARGSMTLQNRTVLEKLEIDLQSWVESGGEDFSMFNMAVRDGLRDTYAIMRIKLKKEGV
jgi:hypothetical protein